MRFSFDQFIEDVRQAARQPEANEAVRDLLQQVVADPAPIAALIAEKGEDEVMLFEDAEVSIWRCRFQSGVVMPPHEHLLDVHIGGVAGGEKSLLFERRNGAFAHVGDVVARTGEVISLTSDNIHAVTAEGDARSLALHVYMGPLSTLKRDLFDWESGAAVEFTQESFDRLKRPAQELNGQLSI